MIGKTVSHYKILEKLGEGGMGVVYKAEDTKLKRTIALKFLPLAFTTNPDAKERFIHEAQAASALDHPNVCDIHDFGESEDGQVFIVMTCYDGETLNRMIDRGPFKITEAIDAAIQIAEGLSEAHQAGISHRDVKPANIFITKSNVVKILDFGLAKLAGRTVLTKSGSTLGTAAYMSPEQASGEVVDHRTDIWSLGVVLYEMLAGKLPFPADYQNALMYSIQNAEPEPLTGLRTGIPMELERIVMKCLKKSPTERYQRLDEFLVDLKGLKRVSPAEQKATTTSSTTISKKSRIPLYTVGVIALIAIAAVALFLLNRREVQKTTATAPKTIAVLPPRNLMKVPGDEALSEGILEGLITELGKIKSLSTIGRQSVMRFSGTDKPYDQIAAELGGIDAIVEPSYQRVGNKLQIHARLIQSSDGKVIWAGSFDRTMDDILVLQSEVAQTIAREIKATVTQAEQTRLTSARPVDPELYRIYLEGRYYFARRNLSAFNKSVQLFQQVLARDSNNALAYAGLSESYAILPFYEGALPAEVFPKAKAAALKAIELDNSLAEAHAALAFTLFYWEWDWAAAESELLKALDLKPSYVVAHHWYAEFLSAMGRHEQALAEIKRAQELDPLSPLMLAIGGEIRLFARRYDDMILQCQKALDLDSTFTLARAHLFNAYFGKKMYAEAEKWARLAEPDTLRSLRMAYIYAATGKRADAVAILDARQRSKDAALDPIGMAIVWACLGEKTLALDWLEQALNQRDPSLVFLNVSPKLDPLRSEPRFKDLLRRVGLPATPVR